MRSRRGSAGRRGPISRRAIGDRQVSRDSSYRGTCRLPSPPHADLSIWRKSGSSSTCRVGIRRFQLAAMPSTTGMNVGIFLLDLSNDSLAHRPTAPPREARWQGPARLPAPSDAAHGRPAGRRPPCRRPDIRSRRRSTPSRRTTGSSAGRRSRRPGVPETNQRPLVAMTIGDGLAVVRRLVDRRSSRRSCRRFAGCRRRRSTRGRRAR